MGIDSVNPFNNPYINGLSGQPAYQSNASLGSDRLAIHQGRSENPYAGKSVFENLETLEARKNEGLGLSNSNVQQVAQNPFKGEAWNGFTVPENNGTGELRPKVDGFNLYA